jgi:hypothetical protein
MAGRISRVAPVLVGALALALVGAATAASPDVAKMNLQATDVPGAKVVSQHAVAEQGYTAAYVREFAFAAPSGSSHLVILQAETKLAATAALATSDVTLAEKAFRSTLGRKILKATIAKSAKVKLTAVVIGKVTKAAGYDQGFAVPVSFPVKGKRIYEDFLILRLDRVSVSMFGVGLRPVTVGATGKYVTALASHIGTELAPVMATPPTVTGTAQQGQTLTAAPGTWSAPEATFGYQWQRCDAAGANCVDVSGAATATYAVTPADVGATLVVVVTASNRFGSPTASSIATTVVI